jgi:mRNA interferase MazF
MSGKSPRRGELWIVDFSPGRGSEHRGIRPALVIQNDVGNEFAATTIVVTVTTAVRQYPVTVPLKSGEGGLMRESTVNAAQMLTVDKQRLVRRLGVLPVGRMELVDTALRVSLGLS